MPGVIHIQFVGVEVMGVVVNSPAVEGVDQGQHGQVTYNVIHPNFFGEGAVGTVVTDDEEAGEGGAGEEPSKRKEIPRGKGDRGKACDGGSDCDSNRAPGFKPVFFEHLSGEAADNISKLGAVVETIGRGRC